MLCAIQIDVFTFLLLHANACDVSLSILSVMVRVCKLFCVFTGRQRSCKPCTSYDRDVRPSFRLSVRPSVCHTLAQSENDAS